jgi:hypothetical protein
MSLTLSMSVCVCMYDATQQEESELSNRQEMATVSTFLSVMIVIYNLICLAFFTLKTNNFSKTW